MIRPLKFVAGSRRDLSDFPEAVRQEVGHALFVAQEGGRAPSDKTLQGFGGGGVVEIVEDHDGDTYRCVYTTKIDDVIVVLHAFQKSRSAEAKHQNMTLNVYMPD
jgi:phage-related protein